MGRNGKAVVFKPARRVFAGRGRSLLTLGEWKIAFIGIAFGVLVGASWTFGYAPKEKSDRLADAPAVISAEAILPIEKAPTAGGAVEEERSPEPSAEPVLPQVIVAQPDARIGRDGDLNDYTGRVSRVVDGDTLYLEGLSTRIRLWGVDAPERSEQGYDDATETLAALVASERLSCKHVDTDTYGRIVARCYFGDGRDLSEAMIRSGTAEEYLRFTHGYYGGE